jgi:hypothetical protein
MQDVLFVLCVKEVDSSGESHFELESDNESSRHDSKETLLEKSDKGWIGGRERRGVNARLDLRSRRR